MSSAEPRADRTAIGRSDLSRPLRLALSDHLLIHRHSLFDYGCGRGNDIAILRKQGFTCEGWDPHFQPNTALRESDVVNLGYVINVIPDAEERAATVLRAWTLSRSILIVAARLRSDLRTTQTDKYSDGCITRRNTFQKYFDQDELRQWLERTVGVPAVVAAPGIFYLFRDEPEREGFIAKRFRRPSKQTRARQSDLLFERHAETLRPLLDFLSERGRLPRAGELPESSSIEGLFGSLRRAFLVIRRASGATPWEQASEERREDFLVYLALSRFSRRPRFSNLPTHLQNDTKDFFGSYRAAVRSADDLLFSLADQDRIDEAAGSSTVGKMLPEALYIHRDAIGDLPLLLRIYEGAARTYVGDVDDTNVVKLSRRKPKVSYLSYPDFDKEPHPALRLSVSVSLDRFRVRERHFEHRKNPPILHRKEQLLAATDTRRAKFARLTAQEERAGLYEEPSRIGTLEGWLAKLEEKGVRLRGHRVVRAS